MDKNAALAHLGLTGGEDPGDVTKAYGARLATVQEKLVSAQTEADRIHSQTQLSQLVEAFELVTQTGRYTLIRGDESATAVRTPEEIARTLALPGDTSVRMGTGAVLSERIEIGELLGSGGMGNVYAARDRLKEEDIAIKVLRQDLIFSSAAKDRFLAEAKMSCSLSHPNIVRVHDVGVSGGHYYISMERLRGQTLRQRIEAYRQDNRQFTLAEVTDVARQLVDALRYAHRYIVHRDLKPENVWLAEDGTVKLMDFGIARAYSSSQLTQVGATLGTAYYMAPEQRHTARDADWRADQYSLGIVLYELLTGSVPAGAAKPIESIRPDLPKRFAQALMRAMSPTPDGRWQSLDDMLAELRAPASKPPKAAVAVVLIGSFLIATAVGAVYLGGFSATLAPRASSPGRSAAPLSPATAPRESDVADAGSGSGSSQPPVEPPSEPPADASLAVATPVEQDRQSSSPMTSVAPPAAQFSAASDAMARVPDTASGQSAVEMPTASLPASAGQSPMQQCVTQCERDQGECRSINRRSQQECVRAVAFNASGNRISTSTTNAAAADCAFFGHARCQYARNPRACADRMRLRYDVCISNASGNMASRRQDCSDKQRDADQLCLTELRDCRASCE